MNHLKGAKRKIIRSHGVARIVFNLDSTDENQKTERVRRSAAKKRRRREVGRREVAAGEEPTWRD